MNNSPIKSIVEVSVKDLPICCPNPHMTAWNSHPKVTVDLRHGSFQCPYCLTSYQLKAGEKVPSHHDV